ncbi:hypothetical protein EV368DRAFT_78939 [Lentinula lateritia]|uniref:Uncharacterized protein n=1 Tax=Lentinula aff. lateritia TaxID=2804960 RepID=A0ACC1U891_9AGAR|nr:hypothetical protein F5876DRAFT_74279 [Lentinula aff. lateritia]KAJ3856178.1 hypothetical protein EV368DRAFT_78939 [Lentinula lateritia]
MPLTRSQTRKKAAQAQVETENPTGAVPYPPSILRSPLRLERNVITPASTSLMSTFTPKDRQTHRRLERAMSQNLLRAMADTKVKVATAPRVCNSGPKPLRRYETPLELVGKAVNDPALLNAPKANRVYKPRREPSFAAVLEELSEHDTFQPVRPRQQQQLTDLPDLEEFGGIPLNSSYELTEQERGWMEEFDKTVPFSFDDPANWGQFRAFMVNFDEFMKRKIRDRGIESTHSGISAPKLHMHNEITPQS